MDYSEVVFLDEPLQGHRVRMVANGREATSSPAVSVRTDPANAGWFWVNTASGSAYVGQVQTQYASVGQGTQYGSPAAPYVNVQVNTAAPPYSHRRGRKDKTSAGLLALFVGWLGVHKFYLGQVGVGLVYLLFFWTFIPALISFVEAILFFCMREEDFDLKYNT